MATPFVLTKEPAHWWPVVMTLPADGGAVAEHRLELKFVRLGIADFKALWQGAFDDARALVAGETPQTRSADDVAARNRELFDRCVKGWRHIVDGEGSPVPFAEPYIGQMLDLPGFPEAFGQAYFGFWQALPEIVRGNFDPSPAGGSEAAEPAAAETPDTTKTSRRS